MNEPAGNQPVPLATTVPPAIIVESQRSNLVMGVLAGAGAALVGAVLWAVVTVMLKMQIGFMAIGVGLLVAFAVRKAGNGSSPAFGVIGAVFALLGCVIGNLLSACAFIAIQENLQTSEVVLKVLSSPSASVLLLEGTFDAMDLLFYAIAAYEGFKFGRVQVAPAS